MFKWISLAVIGVVLLGLHLTNMYLTQVIATKNHDNTAYLIAEYKARPGITTTSIKSKTALCVTEQVGQSIPALNKLYGEIVLYTVKNIEKDQSTFYKGYMRMMSQQEKTLFSLMSEEASPKSKAIQKMFSDSMEKPLRLLSCVAGKMKAPKTA